MGAESSPKIVIVDESPVRARSSRRLREAGFTGVVHISEMQSLVARIYARPLALFDLVIAQRDIRQLSLIVD